MARPPAVVLRPVADVLVGSLLDALVPRLALPVVDGVAFGVGHLLALLHVFRVALQYWEDQHSLPCRVLSQLWVKSGWVVRAVCLHRPVSDHDCWSYNHFYPLTYHYGVWVNLIDICNVAQGNVTCDGCECGIISPSLFEWDRLALFRVLREALLAGDLDAPVLVAGLAALLGARGALRLLREKKNVASSSETRAHLLPLIPSEPRFFYGS